MPRKHSRRHRHEEEHTAHAVHDESNWLVSYADMMTLLFGFFVLMYAMGKIDHDKFDVVRKDLVKYFGGPLKENPGALNLKAKFEGIIQQLKGTQGEENKLVSFKISNNTLRMALESEILFPSGSAELTPQSAQIIDRMSQELKKVSFDEIEIEGHTDAEPIRSLVYPSNWELSASRSSRIVRRMIENGLDQKKLTAKGFADSRPEFPHFAPDGKIIVENKVKNRRVVMIVKLPNPNEKQKELLEKQGFRGLASDIRPAGGLSASEDASQGEENTEETDDLKKKLLEAQIRYQEATKKLKTAQDLEKSIREMELLTKKTEEVERKIQSVEKKAEETINRAQKLKQEVEQTVQ